MAIFMKKRSIYIIPAGTDVDDGKVIDAAIKWNLENIEAFTRLESYVDDMPVMNRVAPNPILAIHNFANYITNINVGYLVGTPIDYKASDNMNLDTLMENFEQQDISELDSDIASDCSMFGQAFEGIYIDEETSVRSAKLSPYNTIVLYDDTFKHNKLAAIYYSQRTRENGTLLNDEFDVIIWTPTHTLYRTLKNKELTEQEDNPDAEHYFGEVPVIHYLNNRRMKGDYEPVLSLIDAYNILQSDRVIDREKLVDAILAFYGAKMTREDMELLKENRSIGLPEGAKAEYLIKSIDEADADVLRRTLAADIHKFSMTPDLTDESFGNSPSGVSILYKLLAFEQNIKKKERRLEVGLRTRLKIYTNVMTKLSKAVKVDPRKVELVFRRALPKNDFETSQMINNIDGLIDSETLAGQLSFVKDASQVVEKAKAERQDTGNFGTDEGDE